MNWGYRQFEEGTNEKAELEKLLENMYGQLWAAVFMELEQANPEVDLYRRNLQRSLVGHLASALREPAVNSDLPALSRAALAGILGRIEPHLPGATDDLMRAHLHDLRFRIQMALDPRGRNE